MRIRRSGRSIEQAAVTVAEVLVGPARHGRLAEAEQALAELQLHAEPLGEPAGRQLARLRADTALKLPDCCVLLVAQTKGGSVVTFDAALARAARRRDVDVVGPLAGAA